MLATVSDDGPCVRACARTGGCDREKAAYLQATRPGEPFATIAALVARRRAPISRSWLRTGIGLVLGTRRAHHTHAHARLSHRWGAGVRIAACRDRLAGVVRLRVLRRVAMRVAMHGGMRRDALSICGIARRVGRVPGMVGGCGLACDVRVRRVRVWGARSVPVRGRGPSAGHPSGILVRELESAEMGGRWLPGLVWWDRPRQLLWREQGGHVNKVAVRRATVHVRPNICRIGGSVGRCSPRPEEVASLEEDGRGGIGTNARLVSGGVW